MYHSVSAAKVKAIEYGTTEQSTKNQTISDNTIKVVILPAKRALNIE